MDRVGEHFSGRIWDIHNVRRREAKRRLVAAISYLTDLQHLIIDISGQNDN